MSGPRHDGRGSAQEPFDWPDADAEGGGEEQTGDDGRGGLAGGGVDLAMYVGFSKEHPLAVAEDRAEDHQQQYQGDRDGPAEPGLEAGPGDADLAGGQAERRQPHISENPK